MSYGLYDGDLRFYARVPFFNLELMKIATYYKRKHEIVSLSPQFTPQFYSHFLIRQDYYGNTGYDIDPNTDMSKFSFHGRAFDGKQYKPLPLEIERCKPDIHLYDKIEDQIVVNPTVKSMFSVIRRAEHLRLSLDGYTVWSDFEKQLRGEIGRYGIIFHDYDVNQIEGAYELITDLLPNVISNRSGRRVGMKFPLQTNSLDDFIRWLHLPPLNIYYSIQHNGIIQPKYYTQLSEILTRNAGAQCTINITGNTTYNQFITKDILTAFESILDLRRLNLNFPLIYGKDFFIDNRWKEVVRLIQQFNNHIGAHLSSTDYRTRVAPYETFYDYVKKETKEHILYGSRLSKQKAEELFQFVRENNYELFTRFYEYCGEEK